MLSASCRVAPDEWWAMTEPLICIHAAQQQPAVVHHRWKRRLNSCCWKVAAGCCCWDAAACAQWGHWTFVFSQCAHWEEIRLVSSVLTGHAAQCTHWIFSVHTGYPVCTLGLMCSLAVTYIAAVLPRGCTLECHTSGSTHGCAHGIDDDWCVRAHYWLIIVYTQWHVMIRMMLMMSSKFYPFSYQKVLVRYSSTVLVGRAGTKFLSSVIRNKVGTS